MASAGVSSAEKVSAKSRGKEKSTTREWLEAGALLAAIAAVATYLGFEADIFSRF